MLARRYPIRPLAVRALDGMLTAHLRRQVVVEPTSIAFNLPGCGRTGMLPSGQIQTEESGAPSAISRSSGAHTGFEAFDSIH